MDPKQENVDLHDDEKEIVDEAKGHDMKNAEQQSVDSVDKTDDSIKQAPTRKGDKRNAEKMPKTKAGMINAMYQVMSGMKKDQLSAAYNKMMGEDVEVEFEEEKGTVVETTADFSEDLDALIESEATLSEEFKEKTAIIFEAALTSKLSDEIDRLEEQYRSELDEEITRTREDLVEKVDSYLNYVVENWMEENKLAIQQGLRTEIAEEFMGKLKDLFTEAYIEVPESKVDLVDELAQQVAELEEQLNSTTESAIQMSEKLESYQRDAIIREHSGDLAETQVEKLKSLVESVDFEDAESFASKVKTVKESYFNKKQNSDESILEEVEGDDTDTVASPSYMDRYVTAIRRTQK